MADDSTNTALAITKDDMAALSPAQRAQIAIRKNANIVAAQIAGTNWGKGLDVATQRAVSDWGLRTGIDVATEIFVLGGNIYLNAQMYINRGIDLIMRGILLDYNQRYLQDDSQLDMIVREVLPATASAEERADLAAAQAAARREIRERRLLRIKHGVQDDPKIKCIVLTEIVLVAMPHTPFYGLKWCPHPNAKSDDPVGTQYPQETALTRSARRAWKQIVRQVPEVQRFIIGAEEDAAANVNDLLKAHHQRALASGEEAKPQLAEGTVEEAAIRSRRGMVPVPDYVTSDPGPSPRAAANAAKMADPFVTPGTESIDTPFDDKTPAPAGPVATTLFGTDEVMEPTAEERAIMRAKQEAEEIAEDDRRVIAADAERERLLAERK